MIRERGRESHQGGSQTGFQGFGSDFSVGFERLRELQDSAEILRG